MQGNHERYSICVMGMPEEEREKEREKIFKAIMSKDFPTLMSDIKQHIQEAQRTTSRMKRGVKYLMLRENNPPT